MKTKCPHCGFKFDTAENITPPFKNNQRVRFVKSQVDCNNPHGDFGYYDKSFNFTGKVIDQKLIRAKDYYDRYKKLENKDAWRIQVQFVPCGNYNGYQSYNFWAYQLKSI